jgi:hypothetical protein
VPGSATIVSANERPLDIVGMDERMDSIRLRQILGGALTDQELMCLQIEQNGFGCGTCSSLSGPRGFHEHTVEGGA